MNNDVLEFGLDELLTALQGATVDGAADGGGVYTTRELCEMSGIPYSRLMRGIHALRRAGRLVPEAKMIERVDGIRQRVRGFRFVSEAAGE